MIEAVIWDFGGVLTTSPFEAFTRFETERGLPADIIRRTNAANHLGNAWAKFERAEVDIEAFDDSEPPALGMIQRAEVEREARRLGDAMGLAVDWPAVARLDDEMLVNAIAQVAPFDVGAKQALLEQPTLDGRADLLVQLMQFHRMAVTGGAEIEPTLQ